jgi:hypothetical protein
MPASARLLSLKPVVASASSATAPISGTSRSSPSPAIRLVEPPDTATILMLSLAALGIAALSWRFVEQPFRDRRRLGLRGVLAGGLAASLAVAAAALPAIRTGGLPDRIAPEIRAAEQALERLRADRRATVAVGRCQYSGGPDAVAARAFLAGWDCTGPGPGPASVAVVGDSHAADTAAALRLAGHGVIQMTGQGCALAPAEMTPACRALFEALRARLAAAAHRPLVVLANRWGEAELGAAVLAATVAFWEGVAGGIVFVTTRPVWPGLAAQIVRGAPRPGPGPFARPCWAMDRRFAALSEAPAVADALAGRGAGRVVSAGIVAAIADPCGPYAPDGTPLLVDDGHLSPEGAARYGRALAAALGLGPGAGAPVPPGP